MQGVLADSLDQPMEVDTDPSAHPSTHSTGIGKSAKGRSSSKSLANRPPRREVEYEGSSIEIETDKVESHSLQSSPAARLGAPPHLSTQTDLGLGPVAPVVTDQPSVASIQAATAADAAARVVIATAKRGLLLARQNTSSAGPPALKKVAAGTEEARVLLAQQIAFRSSQSSSKANKPRSKTDKKGKSLQSGGGPSEPAAKTPLHVPGLAGLHEEHNPFDQFKVPVADRARFLEYVKASEQAQAQAKAKAQANRSRPTKKQPVSDLTITAPQPTRKVHLAASSVHTSQPTRVTSRPPSTLTVAGSSAIIVPHEPDCTCIPCTRALVAQLDNRAAALRKSLAVGLGEDTPPPPKRSKVVGAPNAPAGTEASLPHGSMAQHHAALSTSSELFREVVAQLLEQSNKQQEMIAQQQLMHMQLLGQAAQPQPQPVPAPVPLVPTPPPAFAGPSHALQPPAGFRAPDVQRHAWRLRQQAIAAVTGIPLDPSLAHASEYEAGNLDSLSAELTPAALDKIKVELEGHVTTLQAFMQSSKRPSAVRWAAPASAAPSAYRGEKEGEKMELVDGTPFTPVGLPVLDRHAATLSRVLYAMKGVKTPSQRASAVRVHATDYKEYLRFSFRPSADFSGAMGAFGSPAEAVTSCMGLVEKQNTQAGERFKNAEEAARAPRDALRCALATGSANEAGMQAVHEASDLLSEVSSPAKDLLKRLKASVQTLEGEETLALDVEDVETISNLVQSCHAASRRLEVAQVAVDYVEESTQAAVDAAARGLRSALSRARQEFMTGFFSLTHVSSAAKGKKSDTVKAQAHLRGLAQQQPYMPSSLFGGSLRLLRI